VTTLPTVDLERELLRTGKSCVIGLDEVGKGAWAGPLVIGAAVLTNDVIDAQNAQELMGGARDSKQLTEIKREAMFDHVAETCKAWAVGAATHEECDRLGMNKAQKLATKRALEQLGKVVDLQTAAAVIDGKWDFVSPLVGHVVAHVKADASCLSVSAASVLAKVSRDRLMRDYSLDYPMWSFDTNKGYPCPKHRVALQGYGPSAIHRVSWAFMENYVPWLEAVSSPDMLPGFQAS
jgi:ribonuclease HII